MFRSERRPKFADTLKFPDDITELEPANLCDLMGKYTALYTYANQELALCNIEILQLDTEISRRRGYIFVKEPRINQQEKWKRDTILESDKIVLGLKDRLVPLKAKRTMLEMYLSNFDKYAAVLSRELSRRQFESRP